MSKDIMNVFNYEVINETKTFDGEWTEHHVFLFLNGWGASVFRASFEHPDTYELMLVKGTKGTSDNYKLEGDDPIFNLDFEDVYNALVDIAEGNIEDYYF